MFDSLDIRFTNGEIHSFSWKIIVSILFKC